MPELPEVETVVRGLSASITGQRVVRVTLNRADLRFPFPVDFAKNLAGCRIEAITRRAKYLLFALDNGHTMIAHLGMSGGFSVVDTLSKPPKKHDHVVFSLGDGRTLIYNDPRRFGIMDMASSDALAQHELLYHLGPEPFSKAFSVAYLRAKLLRRNGPVKPVLMDQQLVVGVGNIYASEALFLAGIDPRKPASSVADKASLIIKSIRKVLRDAIESGGSSLRDFVNISGDAGYFQHRFNVYERAGDLCFSCGSTIASMRQAGRSTFFCPACQQ